jgi:Putative peptidoglycan binding domain/Trypsin-like peptidase domain
MRERQHGQASKAAPALAAVAPASCALCRPARFAAIAVLAAAVSAASPAPSAAGPTRFGGAGTVRLALPVAVFGRDDRVALPTRLMALKEKIGLLFSQRSRLVCTAFCVAANVVATAGHCLYRTHGEPAPPLADFWFARNFEGKRHFERIAGSGRSAAAQHVMSGSMDLNVRPPIDASKDWALVRLSRPACDRGVLPVRALSMEAVIAEATASRIFQVSYHRDFKPWRLAYSGPCGVARSFAAADWPVIVGDFADPTQVLLHTCDTGGASSGSPLLLETGEGIAVVGVNVGTYVQSTVLMEDGRITKRLEAAEVANTAVNSDAFAGKLKTFREAAILTSPAEIRALQMALKLRALYAGTIDGAYGAGLRSAIEAFEGAQDLPVTGLATKALLQRLHGRPLQHP